MVIVVPKMKIPDLIEFGWLEVGEGTQIDETAWICYPTKKMEIKKVKIGRNCRIRNNCTIYSDVTIGDNVSFGDSVTIREGCRIGDNTSIGTGVKVENDTIIGKGASVETQSHITAKMIIEDNVFLGAAVITNNDFGMRYKRKGHGERLKGPTLRYGARIGSNAIIMAGVEIGRHSIINAGEIVRKNVPDKTMMFTGGHKVIYKKIKEDRFLN